MSIMEIKKEHARVWLEMANKVNECLKNLDTDNTKPVNTILDNMNTLLKETGYKVLSDYQTNEYEYFDFDLFRKDGYGLRIFLGYKWFNEVHVHGLRDMYLYAPKDEDDYMSDVTIEELEKLLEE